MLLNKFTCDLFSSNLFKSSLFLNLSNSLFILLSSLLLSSIIFSHFSWSTFNLLKHIVIYHFDYIFECLTLLSFQAISSNSNELILIRFQTFLIPLYIHLRINTPLIVSRNRLISQIEFSSLDRL